MRYFWRTKVLHKYDSLLHEGAMSAVPNTKQLQPVTTTEDGRSRIGQVGPKTHFFPYTSLCHHNPWKPRLTWKSILGYVPTEGANSYGNGSHLKKSVGKVKFLCWAKLVNFQHFQLFLKMREFERLWYPNHLTHKKLGGISGKIKSISFT